MRAAPAPAASPAAAPREALAGLIERVTFHSPETGFCVLRVRARGQRDAVTVVGHAASVAAGEWVTASGDWVNDRTHGLQFRAAFLRTAAPTSAEGIERYLASGLVRGVGPVYARALVQAFGSSVFEVVEASPARLREVRGVGPRRAERIAAAWAEQKAVREIMVFLHEHGVGTARAVRIHRAYGAEAIAVISDNPYRLARDVRGIGFKTADALAGRLGIEPTATVRLRAGVSFALTTALDEGHCGLPVDELLPRTAKLLEVDPRLIGEALEAELAEGAVVEDTVDGTPCVFLAGLHRAERTIAGRLRALAAAPLPWEPIDPERALPWVEARTGLALAESQRAAVRAALASKVLVLTGGPGVGKTTVVNAILRVLRARRVRVLLAAPTGRAAKRLSEATGLEARTVHRLLEADPGVGGFRRGADHPLEADLVVVDEASMLDVLLMRALLLAVPDRAALLVVGDIDQLPSVGPGQVLADVIASGAVPVARLTEVFRQAAESRIVTNAHRINRGLAPEPAPRGQESDYHFLAVEDPERAAQRVVELVASRIPRRFGLDPARDVQVLCPMARGAVGARALNLALQQALLPTDSPGPRVERFGWTYAPGLKVMQTENDYDREVHNGDMGFVTRIDAEEGEATVDFDGRAVTYGLNELDAVTPAYAVTVHKAQGSEYPAVVIPVLMQHYPMLQRSLVYTALTRGKRLVVLVGQSRALALAVRQASGRRRWTKLGDWLRA